MESQMQDQTDAEMSRNAEGDCRAAPCCAFSVGDRVTTVKSESLPESMEGIPCIVTSVDMGTDEEYFRYEVAFRTDHKTPIRIGEDVIANEFLDRSNIRMGWCGTCEGEGVVDSGGIHPWGEWTMMPCPECQQENAKDHTSDL